jgi:hypothetical protein
MNLNWAHFRTDNFTRSAAELCSLPARAEGGDILYRKGAKGNDTGTTVRGRHRRDRHLHGRPDGRERDVRGGGGRLDLGGIAELFVTNVLNGTVAAGGKTVNSGTVLRLVITTAGQPRLLNATRIGSGFPETLNDAALVIGPTGVGLAANGTLYVADTLNNR